MLEGQIALRGLLMAWLQQHSFDDCRSAHDTPGFLSAAELTEQLQTFAASGAVEYTAGLTADGVAKLLKKMLDEQVQNGVLYGAETAETAETNVENIMGGKRARVKLWRLRPRGVSESELQQQAEGVDVTVAALRRKVLAVAAATGDEQLLARARVVGDYQPGQKDVRLRSLVQVTYSPEPQPEPQPDLDPSPRPSPAPSAEPSP